MTNKKSTDVQDAPATSTTELAQPTVKANWKLSPEWERRGANEWQVRTLHNLFPGANPNSLLLVWDYCISRRLDPLKKPCHIVPMRVKTATGWETRDIIMPGIYELRTTAHRTGEYMGHDKPRFGDVVLFQGLDVPATCEFTVYRWNKLAQVKVAYTVELFFEEWVGLDRDGKINERWRRGFRQMFAKCAEAAALREAFPDEVGGMHTDDEMQGRVIDITPAGAGSTLNIEPKAQAQLPESCGDALDKLQVAAMLGTRDLQAVWAEQPVPVREALMHRQEWSDVRKVAADADRIKHQAANQEESADAAQ